MNKGLLIILSGPSGAGKGTVLNKLVEQNKDIKLSVSCTTRKPRQGEKDGINYFFVTHETFAEMLKKNELLEYAKVFDNFYGTPAENVEKLRNKGINVVLEIDVQGALKVMQKVKDIVTIFIAPPSMGELKRRLTERKTETEEQINKRFATAYLELGYVDKYDYIVLNDTVDNAVKSLKCIIASEKMKVKRNSEYAKKLIEEGEKLL